MKRTGLSFLGVVTASVIILPALYGASDRIFPGVNVGGVPVGTLTASEASAHLAAQRTVWEGATVEVETPDGSLVSTTRAQLGLRLSAIASSAQALSFGRANLLDNFSAFYKGWFGSRDVSPTDEAVVPVNSALARYERVADPGTFQVVKGALVTTPPADGFAIEWKTLQSNAVSSKRVKLPLRTLPSPTDAQVFRTASSEATRLTSPRVLAFEDKTYELSASDRVSLLSITWQATGPVVQLDLKSARAQLDHFAPKISRGPTDARVAIDASGTLIVAAPSVAGRELDIDLSMKAFVAALASDTPRVNVLTHSLSPTFDTAAAQVWLSKATKLSSTTTYYDGSAVRAVNIRNSAKALDNTQVAAGGTFSFWDRVGVVDYSTGYVDAGAIIDGVSGSALAGGICQVSTTLFGSIYRLGVPILERHPHDYYIRRYELGLDAAVFDPGADLRFANDMSNPILLHSINGFGVVTFEAWGIAEGRNVALATSDNCCTGVAKGQRRDPAFPPGYVEPGRNVYVSRTVTYADGKVTKEGLPTSYTAVWGGP